VDVREELKKGLVYFQNHGSEMAELYRLVTGSAIDVTCQKCIIGAFRTLERKYDNRVWKMKGGKIIDNPFGQNPTHYNRTNVTDEISEKLINLGYRSYFE
jgi:hypothetical protein